MMKNIYSLEHIQLSQEDFKLISYTQTTPRNYITAANLVLVLVGPRPLSPWRKGFVGMCLIWIGLNPIMDLQEWG